MGKLARHAWLLGIFSAVLLLLPFSIVGPVPFWRTFFAWVAFVPLFCGLLAARNLEAPKALLRATLAAYLMGFLWFTANCYWIYQTMRYYGGLPPLISAGILILYSLVLGLYFAALGFLLCATAKLFRNPAYALAAAPFFWVALELLSARLTKVPWDLLGYSQIDNFLLTRMAPYTGVYGLSFVLVAGNALVAWGVLAAAQRRRFAILAGGVVLVVLLQNGDHFVPSQAPVSATAVLLQQNLNVDEDNRWPDDDYERHVNQFIRLSMHTCGPFLAGIPNLTAYLVTPDCPERPVTPGVIVWPESPAPFYDKDPRLLNALQTLARSMSAPVIAGTTSLDRHGAGADMYNSALFVSAAGTVAGRYDKIHLVPWGEYIPYKNFFSFAKNLTQEAGDMTHGWRRVVFASDGHTFGVFICYEEIFGDEIRLFAKRGAQVLVNISNDGWYGDTCAPWQTLNMSRMRAVENRRWLLRDTNTGITTIIDPFGRLTASVERHTLTSLAARYGYRSDVTFYTAHGDVFATACGIMSVGIVAVMGWIRLRRN
ncbi:MAG: apolipoprotein N-acyltransferase [Acidobacteriaceae bacterium]